METLRLALPKPEPWPPTDDSFARCLYERLGDPKERMAFMDMYMKVGELVWDEVRCSEEADGWS